MIWRRHTETSIRTEDGSYKVSKSQRYYKTEQRSGWEYDAWGPEGSQKIDFIADATAKQLKDLGRTVQPEILAMQAGRAHLGHFDSAEEARQACARHATGEAQLALV